MNNTKLSYSRNCIHNALESLVPGRADTANRDLNSIIRRAVSLLDAPQPHSDHLVKLLSAIQEMAGSENTANLRRVEQLARGIVPKTQIFSCERIQGEVFASELLRKPVKIERDPSNGKVTVKIDRRDVDEYVITNAGRGALCESLKQPIEELQEADRIVHDFICSVDVTGRLDSSGAYKDMLKVEGDELTIYTEELPLRWASGGVLPIVERDSATWLAVLFRDITPYGWNLPIGATERQFDNEGLPLDDLEQELSGPIGFIVREFFEEFLLLTGPPRDNPSLVATARRPSLPSVTVLGNLDKFWQRHTDLRWRDEALAIKVSETSDVTFSERDTNMALEITVSDGSQRKRVENVYVVINLTELGIEVVKPLAFEMTGDSVLLDGEILVREDDEEELVRMPWGLLSDDYVTRAFSEWNKTTYVLPTDDNHSDNRRSLPSIEPEVKPSPRDDICVMRWDIAQRWRRKDTPHVSQRERDRYKAWEKNFGEYFPRDGLPDKCPPTFTPVTAKVFNLYARERLAARQ